MKKNKCNLHVMVHHYTSEKYLFKTITSYEEDEREIIFNEIVTNKSWYWGRYSPDYRNIYIKKRLIVEELMYNAFSIKYWKLKEKSPVYFYIFPSFSVGKIEDELKTRQKFDEPDTKYLLVDLRRITDKKNITFTICDSLRSYIRVLKQKGFTYEDSEERMEHDDHGNVFHIKEIHDLYPTFRK